jgi:hypothetical protein
MLRGIETETPEYVRVQQQAVVEHFRKQVRIAEESVRKATEAFSLAARHGHSTEEPGKRVMACMAFMFETVRQLEIERATVPEQQRGKLLPAVLPARPKDAPPPAGGRMGWPSLR